MRALLKITKALSDRTRLRILRLLHEGELCVCQVVAALKLAASTVSRHLALLEDAGLVRVRRDGRWAYYRLPAARRTGVWAWLDVEVPKLDGPDPETVKRMRCAAQRKK
jgi:ArsR family transcriptional regulator, arsenate/arsenite/antimonite-responsive transcriptional repressor